jgi:hypothetical protein
MGLLTCRKCLPATPVGLSRGAADAPVSPIRPAADPGLFERVDVFVRVRVVTAREGVRPPVRMDRSPALPGLS